MRPQHRMEIRPGYIGRNGAGWCAGFHGRLNPRSWRVLLTNFLPILTGSQEFSPFRRNPNHKRPLAASPSAWFLCPSMRISSSLGAAAAVGQLRSK